DATGVAADENTIVGTGVNPSGKLEAYRVSLESPQPGARIGAGADFACALFDNVDIDGTVVDGTPWWGSRARVATARRANWRGRGLRVRTVRQRRHRWHRRRRHAVLGSPRARNAACGALDRARRPIGRA